MQTKSIVRTCRMTIVDIDDKNPTIQDLLAAEHSHGTVEFAYSMLGVNAKKFGLNLRGLIKVEVLKLHPAAPGSFLLSGLFRQSPGLKPIKVEGWFNAKPAHGHLDLTKIES